MDRYTLALALVLAAGSAEAAAVPPHGFLCVADNSTGFNFDGERWRQSSLAPDTKFFLKPLGEKATELADELGNEGSTWGYFTFDGPLFAAAACTLKAAAPSEFLGMHCKGVYEVEFNADNLRFLWIYSWGYTDGSDDNENTPAMAIGKCSPF